MSSTITMNEAKSIPDVPVDESDWWCIKRDSVCDCGAIHKYVHNLHDIIVWPAQDDPNILEIAEMMEGQVVLYEHSLGKCVSYYLVSNQNGL